VDRRIAAGRRRLEEDTAVGGIAEGVLRRSIVG